jgi:C4-dicarboxylate-specific signal transduction histidine kinase
MGQLAGSIAHVVSQPIGAVRNNAHAALRFLTANPPNMPEVREALECVVGETYRWRRKVQRRPRIRLRIVTAEKWEQAATTIGMSITTVTDDMLQERGCPTIGPSS